MNRIITVLFVLLLMSLGLSAQTTTTTATISDSDGVAWSNAPYTITFVGSSPGQPSVSGQPFTQKFSGTTNSSGALAVTLSDVASIQPANSTWQFSVTPAVTGGHTFTVNIPVTGASQDVSSQINAVIAPPRLSGGIGVQGYADVEVSAVPGNQYFRTSDSTLRCYLNGWNACGGGSTSSTPLFYFQGYGDSYVLGSGASNPAVGGAFAQLAKTIPTVPNTNNAVSGANSDAINLVIWTKVQPSPQVPSAFIMDGGANDGPNCGTSTGCLTNFQEEVNASIGRLTIPNQERTWGSACTQTAGTWTADNAAYNIPAPSYYLNPGTAMSATGSGAILTCVVNSRVASTKVGLNFQAVNSQTGTFTVSVDGAPQTDQCSGTTTFTSAPCSGVNLLTQSTTIFRQEFTGTLGTSHTVVVTTTNAAKVDVTAIDTITPTPQANSNYVIAFGPNAAFTNSALYNTAMGTVANQFTTDGARVRFADIQSTTNPGPGLNNTTDISQTATASCDASANANHPNDICGYFHLAQTITNAAKAAGWYIFGVPQGFGLLTAQGGSISGMIVNGAPSYVYFTMNAVALPTSAIAAATCTVIPGSAWTVAGVTASTHVGWGWSGDPGGTVGQLVIVVAPTAGGTVVGRACNPSANSITPTTQAINWWVGP